MKNPSPHYFPPSYFVLFLILGTLNFPAMGQVYHGKSKDIQSILQNITSFSQSVMASEAEKIGLAYTKDAKIFPSQKEIIRTRESIQQYWKLPSGVSIVHHKIHPEEIRITGKVAYDYGLYEGSTQKKDGSRVDWKGKYVIVWKKVRGEWKIYLDIWNRIES